MSRLLTTRAAAIALLIGLNTFLPTGCALDEGSDATSPDLRVGLDYYDPWFDDYGGWGPGYWVGPHRQVIPRPDVDRGRPPHPKAYSSAPEAHPVPTIPSRPHSRDPRSRSSSRP